MTGRVGRLSLYCFDTVRWSFDNNIEMELSRNQALVPETNTDKHTDAQDEFCVRSPLLLLSQSISLFSVLIVAVKPTCRQEEAGQKGQLRSCHNGAMSLLFHFFCLITKSQPNPPILHRSSRFCPAGIRKRSLSSVPDRYGLGIVSTQRQCTQDGLATTSLVSKPCVARSPYPPQVDTPHPTLPTGAVPPNRALL